MEGVQMTPEQQRVAIAEACGWKTEYRDAVSSVTALPDYLNDLNAMHDAEKVLNADQMISMDYHLDVVVGNGRQGLNCEYFLWSATAAQFAEAFLRTIGKWKECK
jgi:hypothetical protein